MCGIAGIYRFKSKEMVADDEVTAMCRVMEYRGPDGHGIFTDREVGLGHRRLTIIDKSERSNQPMLSDDSQTVISYNGEIYNYLELQEELITAGFKFRTTSDTEVLLQMYRCFGSQAWTRLNGMFAFAVWDKQNQEFILVRDPVGIKPLFYTLNEQGLVFSSEIKSLLQVKDIKASVNTKMIDSYMSMGYCPTEETLFENIYKLPPGHYLRVKDNEVSIQCYWDLKYDKQKDLGEAYYLKKTEELLTDAVKLQLRSDVPLGVFLSGGLDSSAVVALMSQLGVKDIKTFSVAWDHGHQFDETQYARQISEQFNTDHQEHHMTAEDFLNFLPDYIRHMDEPVTESAAISLYYLSLKTKQKVTVVLSGEGSDEVFGGYSIYKIMHWINVYKKLPGPLRKFVLNPLIKRMGQKWQKYINLSELTIEDSYFGVSFYEEEKKKRLYSPTFQTQAKAFTVRDMVKPFYDYNQGQDSQTKMQYLDLKTWLVDDLLVKADRMSMAASLELRVPFLDHRLLDFIATMPSKYRIKNRQNKYIIKKVMEKFLPDNIIYRKKMGFPTPLAILFQGQLKTYVAKILDSDQAHARGYFKPEIVRLLLTEHASGKQDHHKILWQLLVLELWHREYIDG